MKYAAIDNLRASYPVSVLCCVLGISQRSYCRHQRRHEAEQTTGQRISDEALLVHIRSIHAASSQCYGWPRIWAQLRALDLRVGKERVRCLMQRHGIVGRARRRYKVTTRSNHTLPAASNLLARQFSPERPNQAWAGDITYIATAENWLYLAGA